MFVKEGFFYFLLRFFSDNYRKMVYGYFDSCFKDILYELQEESGLEEKVGYVVM